jgi:hypothetical protein
LFVPKHVPVYDVIAKEIEIKVDYMGKNFVFVMTAVFVGTVIKLLDTEYYPAIPFGPIVYISPQTILEEFAIFILSTSQKFRHENAVGTLSIYTKLYDNAKRIAKCADADHRHVDRNQGEAEHHKAEISKSNATVYNHFHPGLKETKLAAHSFYGGPIFT